MGALAVVAAVFIAGALVVGRRPKAPERRPPCEDPNCSCRKHG